MISRQARYYSLFLVAGLSFAQNPVIWKPAAVTSWQWQLSGPLDQSVDAQVYDIDLFNNGAQAVAALHRSGRRVICYVSVGTFEPWRPDADRFPRDVRGLPVEGFEDETWLDIRRLDVLGPIMEARFDLCKAKGFDAVEPDNVDGYQNESGFPLTAGDQLRYNRFLANAAHARGLSVGLKNDLEQVSDLINDFDWALNEQCLEFHECDLLAPFIAAKKTVFHVEYRDNGRVCPSANALGFNTLIKKQDLDARRSACRQYPAGPALAAAVNGASGEVKPVAPGEILAIYGRLLGPQQLLTASTDANGRLPARLAGTEVLIGGVPAPLVYAQATQVAVLVPYGSAGKDQVDVEVTTESGRSDLFTLKVAAAAPGIFTIDGAGSGQAAMLNEDGSLNGAGNPARPGSTVTFYATGEGATLPGGVDGQPASPPYAVPKLPVSMRIADKEAVVLYAGRAPGFAGLMQVNVRVPLDAAAGARVPVVLSVGGALGQAGVTMALAANP